VDGVVAERDGLRGVAPYRLDLYSVVVYDVGTVLRCRGNVDDRGRRKLLAIGSASGDSLGLRSLSGRLVAW